MVRLADMSIRKLALHALLCLTLILNGSGFAVAGTQMHKQHAQTERMDALPAPMNAHAGCMEHAAAATKTSKHSAQTGFDSAPADCCGEAACCRGSVCASACAAAAAATLPSYFQGFQISPQALDAVPVLAEHPAPALRNRYRPPIA